MKRIITIACVLILGLSLSANAAKIQASWNANTESDLAGYKLYYGTSKDKLSNVIDVGKVTSYTSPDLAAGDTYYFAVSAYDASGNESELSDIVGITVPAVDTTPPAKPTGVKAVLLKLMAWLKGVFARG